MVSENIAKIHTRIAAACAKAGRDLRMVRIVAVSKNRTAGQLREVIDAGITDIGENKVQEALLKYNELKAADTRFHSVRWHMVGHLQTNKVKDAVKIFDLIQSVDSLHLAREIDRQAARINKVQDVLIEIKTSPEATKTGLKPDAALEVIHECSLLKNIRVLGLMTIAPLVDDPEMTRPYFRMLRELRNTFGSKLILSMGMSDDFEVAIKEGSDMVRIGRAIFES